MTDTIFAYVDGSIYAASVCETVGWIAARTRSAVEIVHVLGRREGPEAQDLSGAIRLGARSALLSELAAIDARRAKLVSARGRAILEDAQALVARAGGDPVTTRLRHGDLVDTVTEAEARATMIVIGKRGEAADFAKGHLGSNLERIVRATTRPVVVAARAFRPVQKVLVAFDGGLSAMKAIEFVASSPLFAGLSVHLITVGAATAGARSKLADAQAVLKSSGIDAETAILPGQPETALAAQVESGGIDLLVMGAYGHSRIRSLIIGSTTTQMIRACKVPVVLVR